MRHLGTWCDEASVACWVGPVDTMGDWTDSHARMLAEAEASHVRRPSPDQVARRWAVPRIRPPIVLTVAARRA